MAHSGALLLLLVLLLVVGSQSWAALRSRRAPSLTDRLARPSDAGAQSPTLFRYYVLDGSGAVQRTFLSSQRMAGLPAIDGGRPQLDNVVATIGTIVNAEVASLAGHGQSAVAPQATSSSSDVSPLAAAADAPQMLQMGQNTDAATTDIAASQPSSDAPPPALSSGLTPAEIELLSQLNVALLSDPEVAMTTEVPLGEVAYIQTERTTPSRIHYFVPGSPTPDGEPARPQLVPLPVQALEGRVSAQQKPISASEEPAATRPQAAHDSGVRSPVLTGITGGGLRPYTAEELVALQEAGTSSPNHAESLPLQPVVDSFFSPYLSHSIASRFIPDAIGAAGAGPGTGPTADREQQSTTAAPGENNTRPLVVNRQAFSPDTMTTMKSLMQLLSTRDPSRQTDNPSYQTNTGQTNNPSYQTNTGQTNNPSYQTNTGQTNNPSYQTNTGQTNNPSYQTNTGQTNNPSYQTNTDVTGNRGTSEKQQGIADTADASGASLSEPPSSEQTALEEDSLLVVLAEAATAGGSKTEAVVTPPAAPSTADSTPQSEAEESSGASADPATAQPTFTLSSLFRPGVQADRGFLSFSGSVSSAEEVGSGEGPSESETILSGFSDVLLDGEEPFSEALPPTAGPERIEVVQVTTASDGGDQSGHAGHHGGHQAEQQGEQHHDSYYVSDEGGKSHHATTKHGDHEDHGNNGDHEDHGNNGDHEDHGEHGEHGTHHVGHKAGHHVNHGTDQGISGAATGGTVLKSPPEGSLGLEDTLFDVDDSTYTFVENMNRLALSVYRNMAPDYRKRNMVLSPLAVSSSLALLFLGARGETAHQLDGLLKLDSMTSFNPHVGYFKFLRYMNQRGSDTSSALCNALIKHEEQGDMFSGYKFLLSRFYQPVIEPNANLQSAAAAAIQRSIDACVSNSTGGLISHFIQQPQTLPAVSPSLVTASGTFFNATLSPSLHVQPVDTTFLRFPSALRRVLATAGLRVRGVLPAGYSRQLDCTLVALPYADGQRQLLLLLPGAAGHFSADGLSQLESRLSPAAWRQLLRVATRQPLEVTLPIISHRTEADLQPLLARMGVTAVAEQATADLSGVNGLRDLSLGGLLQLTEFHLGDGSVLAAGNAGHGGHGDHQVHEDHGAHGAHGDQGAHGAHGAHGDQGAHGAHGAHGDHGDQGAHGAHGAHGNHGDQGAHEDHGDHGDLSGEDDSLTFLTLPAPTFSGRAVGPSQWSVGPQKHAWETQTARPPPAVLAPRTPVAQVRFERAFLYAVRHEATGAILLMGRYLDPHSFL